MIARKLVAGDPGNLPARRQYLDTIDGAASCYEGMGNYDKAIPLVEEAARLADDNLSRFPSNPDVQRDRARSNHSAGFVYRRSQTHRAKALPAAQKGLDA